MMRAENYVRPHRGLDLVLIPCNGGHNYEWHDGHGEAVLSGWTPEGLSLARLEAESRLVEAIGGVR